MMMNDEMMKVNFGSSIFVKLLYVLGLDVIQIFTKGLCAEQKFYGFKNLVKLETVPMKTKILLCTTVFGFSSKTSFFVGLGAILGKGKYCESDQVFFL